LLLDNCSDIFIHLLLLLAVANKTIAVTALLVTSQDGIEL